MNILRRRLKILAAIAIGIVALMWLAGTTGPAYSYDELMDADIACDAEALSHSLVGARSPRAAIGESFSATPDAECLAEKLPELSDEELANWSATLGRARAEMLDEG